MWNYHPELLERPVPRYTSYPTAAEFHDGIGADAQAMGLAAVDEDEPISLYLHIPYCEKICWYCGCNTGAANRSGRLANYLARLETEIDLVAGLLEGRGRVARIALGGGSPNAIAPAQFRSLADRLIDAFGIDGRASWSVEIDPRGFDEAFAGEIDRIGFERASLGVQTFDPAIQQAIGRIQPVETIQQSVDLLRQAGVTSLNGDLMYGLPGQDRNSLLDGVEAAEGMGFDRLAVFGYAHVPHIVPRQRQIDGSALPGPEERFRQAEQVHGRLAGNGWQAVGFDHFARPHDPLAMAARSGAVRRNFQGFTDDPCDVMIGLGASAISRFPDALIQNEHNSGRYGLLVGNRRLAGTRGIATPSSERERGRVIERLLCSHEADVRGLPGLSGIKQRLAPFEDCGLVEWSEGRIRLSDQARPYARAIAAAFDPWRTQSATRFSSAI